MNRQPQGFGEREDRRSTAREREDRFRKDAEEKIKKEAEDRKRKAAEEALKALERRPGRGCGAHQLLAL